MVNVRGNLAVRPERQEQRAKYRPQAKKKVTYKATLPVREKLLYLFTVLHCAAISFFIILRSAYIYDMNLQVQEMKELTVNLQEGASGLRVGIEKLLDWKRIEQIAKENGLSTPDAPVEIEVYNKMGRDKNEG